jgi:hypothetical protein
MEKCTGSGAVTTSSTIFSYILPQATGNNTLEPWVTMNHINNSICATLLLHSSIWATLSSLSHSYIRKQSPTTQTVVFSHHVVMIVSSLYLLSSTIPSWSQSLFTIPNELACGSNKLSPTIILVDNFHRSKNVLPVSSASLSLKLTMKMVDSDLDDQHDDGNHHDDDDDDDDDPFPALSSLSSPPSSSPSSSLTKASIVTANPIDKLLLAVTSDRGSILLGCLGILIILVLQSTSTSTSVLTMYDAINDDYAISTNSINQDVLLAYQTRVNLLAVVACGSVLLNGFTKLDVTVALAETVTLIGVDIPTIQWTLNNNNNNKNKENEEETETDEVQTMQQDEYNITIQWAMESFKFNTPTQTVILLHHDDEAHTHWNVVAYTGIVPESMIDDRRPNNHNNHQQSKAIISPTPILDRFLNITSNLDKNTKETYLPTLQSYVGLCTFCF